MRSPLIEFPVFCGRGNVSLVRNDRASLNFAGSFFYVNEFRIEVRCTLNETLEEVRNKITQKEQSIIDRFEDHEHLYLTTRKPYWECLVKEDGQIVLWARVSATYVKIAHAIDEDTNVNVRQ